VETSVTPGIGILAWATSAPGFEADSLGPATPGGGRAARPEECQFLGPPGTAQSISRHEVTVTTPADRSYLWNGWNLPMTWERIKRSAPAVRDAFKGMEAREIHANSSVEAQ
jgi:hypothetical protein